MTISKNLYNLAKIFHKNAPLYVVGGYVRDFLLGKISNDIDICSALSYNEVEKMLDGTNYEITFINKKMGTTVIKIDGEKYEYTPFRVDNYDGTGKHEPTCVEFCATLKEDASRRDYTINSIYYDILKGEYVDYFGGITDIKNGIMRAVKEPNLTIQEDALRIFRLFRQSSTLGFSIEPQLFEAVKNNIALTENLSGERVYGEYVKTVGNEFFTYDALIDYVNLLGESGLISRYGTAKIKDYEIASGLECFAPQVSLLYFTVIERYFWDNLPKPERLENFADLKIYGEKVQKFVYETVKKDKLPTAVKKEIAGVTAYLTILLVSQRKQVNLDLAYCYYYDIIRERFMKGQAKIMMRNRMVISEINRLYSFDKPVSVKGLFVKGDDLKGLINKEEISTALLKALELVIKGELENDKEVLIKWVKNEYC